MKSTIKSRTDQGFTLVEVLVALGIAGGALVLILSANGASLRKSVDARVFERLERAAESKFLEWKSGAERTSGGALPGFSGYSWEVRKEREDLPPLRKLVRVHFAVIGPGGRVMEWAELRCAAEGGP